MQNIRTILTDCITFSDNKLANVDTGDDATSETHENDSGNTIEEVSDICTHGRVNWRDTDNLLTSDHIAITTFKRDLLGDHLKPYSFR